MLENKWVTKVLKPRLSELLPGCVILKNDPNMKQGIPDITILYHGNYAVLEVKKSKNATHRPNQDWYIEKFRDHFGVYANFVYPENLEEVMDDLEEYFLFSN